MKGKIFDSILTILAVDFFTVAKASTNSPIYWSPLYLSAENQVDVWTVNSSGCDCKSSVNASMECACCVKTSGCQCGHKFPHKCAQCGLEEYCNNLCNVTIDSESIYASSGIRNGQIKSPSLQGPTSCWYRFVPEKGYRVELQIYRILQIGYIKETSCQSGFLRLSEDEETAFEHGEQGIEICGANERFSPPVIMFADKSSPMLVLRVDEMTERSQFLAYFSFTAANNTQGVGFKPNGGKRILNTACDWLYQDFSCNKANSMGEKCIMASPGYPGMYPARIKCKYHITTSHPKSKIQITFDALSFPPNRCETDRIEIYQGSSSNNLLLATICDRNTRQFTFYGPNLLVQFESGPSNYPYNYNGFVASLEFLERNNPAPVYIAPLHSTTPPSTSTSLTVAVHHHRETSSQSETVCVMTYLAVKNKSGLFDSRSSPEAASCKLVFIAKRPTDIVAISLFNYSLRAAECGSYIDIYDGNIFSNDSKKVQQICSPVNYYVKNFDDEKNRVTFISRGSAMSIVLNRGDQSPSPAEYLNGEYSFKSDSADETTALVPTIATSEKGCHSEYRNGKGKIKTPTENLKEDRTVCNYKFVPEANHSLVLKVTLFNTSPSKICHTECGDSGCVCIINELPTIPLHNYLLITNQIGTVLLCLCGNFKGEWLPVIVRTWSEANLTYSSKLVPGATRQELEFEVDYLFKYDEYCGNNIYSQDFGSLTLLPLVEEKKELNFYYHMKCSWLFASEVDRQLVIDISTHQMRPCSAWNVSLIEYAGNFVNQSEPGNQLYTFCPKENNKTYLLPWKTNSILVTLAATTRRPPSFNLSWTSRITKVDNYLAEKPPPHIKSSATAAQYFRVYAFQVIYLLCIYRD